MLRVSSRFDILKLMSAHGVKPEFRYFNFWTLDLFLLSCDELLKFAAFCWALLLLWWNLANFIKSVCVVASILLYIINLSMNALYLRHTHAHTHTHNRFTALWILSGTSRVSGYQKKHSPTLYLRHTHTHNRFTALLEFVRDHPGEQVPER